MEKESELEATFDYFYVPASLPSALDEVMFLISRWGWETLDIPWELCYKRFISELDDGARYQSNQELNRRRNGLR